ncbi:MAG: ATP-binding protein [Roseobacter sp.]
MAESIKPQRGTLPPFEVHVESGQSAAREALEKFLEKLRPLNLDLEEAGTIELVLAEILNNIVEHAYPPAGPSGPIDIHCAQKQNGLLVQIKDRGTAMPDGKLPLGEINPVDVEFDNMPEGGFGWFLIQHLARDVTYTRVNNENHLKMRLAVRLS